MASRRKGGTGTRSSIEISAALRRRWRNASRHGLSSHRKKRNSMSEGLKSASGVLKM